MVMWGKSVEYLEVSGMVAGALCCLFAQSPCGPCHQSAVDLVPSQPFYLLSCGEGQTAAY